MSIKQFQKDMIADAAAGGDDLVRDICAIADLMGDLETVEYIAENYMYCFHGKQKEELEEFLKKTKLMKMTTHSGNQTKH